MAREPMVPLALLEAEKRAHAEEIRTLRELHSNEVEHLRNAAAGERDFWNRWATTHHNTQESLLEAVTHTLGLHLEEANDRLGRHLADVAESYRKALEPPPLPDVAQLFAQSDASRKGAPAHVSDEEAELRFQQEAGMIDATALREALDKLGIPVEIS